MPTSIYNSWYPRYYYILVNKITGKKYFGQTVSDPGINYFGSGIRWKNHCKKYGGHNSNGVECIWKKWFTDKKQAETYIKYFEESNKEYWQDSNTEWLNSIPESVENNPFYDCGEYQKKRILDGNHPFCKKETYINRWTDKHRKKQSEISKKNNKLMWENYSSEKRAKIGNKISIKNKGKNSKYKGVPRTKFEKEKISNSTKNAMNDHDLKKHLSEKAKARCNEEFIQRTKETNRRRVCCIKCGYETGLSSLGVHQKGRNCK